MPTFDSAGAGAARGIRTGFGIAQGLNDRRQKDEALAQSRAEHFSTIFTDAREASLENAKQFAEAAAKAAENNASDEEIEKIRQGSKGALSGYAATIEHYKQSIIASDVKPEEKQAALANLPDANAFVERNMSAFDAAVIAGRSMAAQNEVTTLDAEQVKQAFPSLPEGSVVQKKSDGSATLLYNPAKDSSTLQERIEALKLSGASEEMALGIAAGRFTVSLDPVTREAQVIDLATGDRIGAIKPQEPQAEPPPVLDPTVDPTQATGTGGMITNAINTIADSIGLPLADAEAQQATDALNLIATQSKLLLTSVVPGRPAKDIREELDKVIVRPNDIFQGDARAKSRLVQTQRLMNNEIVRMENMLKGELSPTDRSAIDANLGPLKEMSRSYDTLIKGFDKSGNAAAKTAVDKAMETKDFDRVEALLDAIEAGDKEALEKLLNGTDDNK